MADKTAYQQWQECADKAKSIAADETLELWEKVRGVNGAYAGMSLDELRPKDRNRMLKEFTKVNAIFAQYPIVTFEDYQQMEEHHLREIIKIVSSIRPLRSK